MRRLVTIALILGALFALPASPADSQQYTLVGKWQGSLAGLTEQIVFQPTGQFTSLSWGVDFKRFLTGTYALMPGQNVIQFHMTSYEDSPQGPTRPAETWGGTFQFFSADSFVFHNFDFPAGVNVQYVRVN
jgi:hypothetical protein